MSLWRGTRPVARRGQSGGRKISVPGEHHPREDADGEQQPGDDVEGDHGGVGEHPGATPQQPGDDRQVEGGAGPARGDTRPRLVEQRTDHRHVRARRQPGRHRLAAHEPVVVELGETGHQVDDGDLCPQHPHDSRGDVGTAAQRQDDDERERQREVPVVVEVRRRVDQLAVREQHEVAERGGARAVAGGDRPGRAGPSPARRRTSARAAADAPTGTRRTSGGARAPGRASRPTPWTRTAPR